MFIKKLLLLIPFCLTLKATDKTELTKKEVIEILNNLRKTDTIVDDYLSTKTPLGYDTLVECLHNSKNCERIDVLKSLHLAHSVLTQKNDEPLIQLIKEKSIPLKKKYWMLISDLMTNGVNLSNALHLAILADEGMYYDEEQTMNIIRKYDTSVFNKQALDYLCKIFTNIKYAQK